MDCNRNYLTVSFFDKIDFNIGSTSKSLMRVTNVQQSNDILGVFKKLVDVGLAKDILKDDLNIITILLWDKQIKKYKTTSREVRNYAELLEIAESVNWSSHPSISSFPNDKSKKYYNAKFTKPTRHPLKKIND